MVFMIGFGIFNTNQINNNLENLTSTLQNKIILVTSLKDSVRERSFRLHQMVLIDNPLEVDNQWQLFNSHVAKIADIQQSLLTLELSNKEQALIKKQSKLNEEIISIQLEIANLSLNSNKHVANTLLVTQAIPIQDKVFHAINDLYDHYINELSNEKSRADQVFYRINFTSLVAGLIGTFIVVFTAVWMTKKIKEYENNLNSLNLELSTLIEERSRKLTQTESTQKNIIENSLEGIITTDCAGQIISFNPSAQKIFHYDEDEIIDFNIDNLIEFENAFSKEYIHSIAGVELEITGITKSNKNIPLTVGVSEFYVYDEMLCSLFVKDISEKKHAEKLKNEFVSTVSHELRTPITSLRGSIGLILGGALGEVPNKIHEMLVLANNNSNRLLNLINELLDVQKMESGMMNFKYQEADIADIVQHSVDNLQGFAESFDVDIAIDIQCRVAITLCDEQKIQQVLANLISNAIKFSPKHETITVTVKKVDDDYLVSVRDNGPGIPEEFHRDLFEKFTQNDSSTTRKIGGTGLGLAIAKSILEYHKSDLLFDTELGKGSTFYFKLKAS